MFGRPYCSHNHHRAGLLARTRLEDRSATTICGCTNMSRLSASRSANTPTRFAALRSSSSKLAQRSTQKLQPYPCLLGILMTSRSRRKATRSSAYTLSTSTNKSSGRSRTSKTRTLRMLKQRLQPNEQTNANTMCVTLQPSPLN